MLTQKVVKKSLHLFTHQELSYKFLKLLLERVSLKKIQIMNQYLTEEIYIACTFVKAKNL